MYNVSDKFKSTIKSQNRKSTIYGVLKTTNGTEYLLNDGNIIKDSLYITNQIVNNSKLCFGAVYAGECGLVINSTIDRYSLFGATIVLNFLLDLEDGTGESLPLGVFNVDTPERIGSKIKLTAVDNMSKFDIAVNEDVNGSWYELLSYIANKCGVELAQTQEELEALHINATSQNYTVQQDKIDTYRDALSYLCMVVCANATIDNTGKLKIVQYATSACDSNNEATRLNNCKFSDYTTRYAGVKARFIANENYAPYEASNPDINGLILDLGDIPIVGGTVDGKHDTIKAIMETVTQIAYVPATLYIASNPAYELGDMLTCENVNNTSNSVNVYVMSYKYNYRKKEIVKCYGDNPLLQNIKDKNDKQFSSVESQLSSKDMIIVNATNIKDIIIGQELKEIVTLNFTVNSDCRPICIFTVPFSIDVDGYVEFSLYNGLVALENATYKGYYEAGEHFATFMYLDDMKRNDRRSLRVLVRCFADITSAVRVQDAKIRTLESRQNIAVGDIFPQSKGMWEQGSIARADGSNIDSTTRIRSCFVPIKAGQKYKCTADSSHQILTRHYTANKTYRSTTTSFANADFEFIADATDKYIRFVIRNSSDATITSDDIDNIYWSCEPVLEDVEAVDTTEPIVIVKELATKAIVYSQGINGGKGEWDGTLEFKENIAPVVVIPTTMQLFNAELTALTQEPTKSDFAEILANIEIPVVKFVGFSEKITASEIITDYIFSTEKSNLYEYDKNYVTADGAYKLVTGAPYPQTIISEKIYLTDKSITGIESALATCEGDLIVAVSFDDKQTWKAWNGEQWATLSEDNTGMNKETLEAITFEQWNELYTGATGFYVRVALLDSTQSVEKIVFDFSN